MSSGERQIRRERDDRLSDLFDRCGDCILFRRVSDGEGNEMIKDCCSCIHEYRSPMSDICRECGIAMLNYEERKPKPKTNADRTRQMSDEELAETYAGGCPNGDRLNCGKHYLHGGRDCFNCWLDWLKAPVEGGEG